MTITNVSNSQKANFTCACEEKKKSCSVQTSKGKVTCGGARCCTMSTITSYGGGDMEAISTKRTARVLNLILRKIVFIVFKAPHYRALAI